MAPSATQFRRYYYSQPAPDGGQDNNTLEAVFSTIESDWPETVAKLHRREDANDRLENIFQFMTLQRVRVPASRDAAESMLARTVKDTMKVMLARGELPPLPPGLADLPNEVQVAIDPHRSIHAMVPLMEGIGKLYGSLGFAAVHNGTKRPFLTSDNPVLWFDPSVPFDAQRPYTVNLDGGPIFLAFPLSPVLVLVGSTDYKEVFGQQGLLHTEVPDEHWVELINAHICRFAYEAVIARSRGQEEIIAKYAGISPVHEAVPLHVGKGTAIIHRQVFGPRVAKAKWRDE